MDWKTLSNYVLLVGLFVAMVTMFNQVNARIDRIQAETNARFDEMFDRQDRMQAETNARFDKILDRQDRMQAETNARFDDVLDAIMSFDRRVSHLEGRLDAQSAE